MFKLANKAMHVSILGKARVGQISHATKEQLPHAHAAHKGTEITAPSKATDTGWLTHSPSSSEASLSLLHRELLHTYTTALTSRSSGGQPAPRGCPCPAVTQLTCSPQHSISMLQDHLSKAFWPFPPSTKQDRQGNLILTSVTTKCVHLFQEVTVIL